MFNLRFLSRLFLLSSSTSKQHIHDQMAAQTYFVSSFFVQHIFMCKYVILIVQWHLISCSWYAISQQALLSTYCTYCEHELYFTLDAIHLQDVTISGGFLQFSDLVRVQIDSLTGDDHLTWCYGCSFFIVSRFCLWWATSLPGYNMKLDSWYHDL